MLAKSWFLERLFEPSFAKLVSLKLSITNSRLAPLQCPGRHQAITRWHTANTVTQTAPLPEYHTKGPTQTLTTMHLTAQDKDQAGPQTKVPIIQHILLWRAHTL